MAEQDVARQLWERFPSLERGYGVVKIKGKAEPGKKQEMDVYTETKKGPATVALWEQHLVGKVQLGLSPIREDSTCRWGAIDIDDYKLDHTALGHKIKGLDLPLLDCRSKSGGAHLYCFTSEPVPAKLMNTKLKEWAAALGWKAAEVFPKQDHVAPDGFGNWLNMPYAGGTERPCLEAGNVLTVEEFLVLAAAVELTPSQLKTTAPLVTGGDDFHEGPPCLKSIVASGGQDEGGRDIFLYNVGVYLRKRHGDEFDESMLQEYNDKYCHGPMAMRKVASLADRLTKKEYKFKCKEHPCVDVCDWKVCKTQEFGIPNDGSKGPGGAVPVSSAGMSFGRLIQHRTEPVSYTWFINEIPIWFRDAQQFMRQSSLQVRVVDELRMMLPTMKKKEYEEMLNDRLGAAEVEELPDDATLPGQVRDALDNYFGGFPDPTEKEDLLLYKVWNNSEDKQTYFRAIDFIKILRPQHTAITAQQVWGILKPHGANRGQFNIKGTCVKWWSVPSPTLQSEPLTPKTDFLEEM